jgi:HAD superfamily hydrolase (TIGR01662 family)
MTFEEHLKKLGVKLDEKSLVAFDVDDTLAISMAGSISVEDGGDIVFLPNVKNIIVWLKQAGFKIALCSNQGGVSHGIKREQDVWDTMLTINAELNDRIDLIKVSYYHKTGKWASYYQDKSKPKPDLLDETAVMLGVKIREMIFVGDGFTDEKAAKNSNIDFIYSHKFFGWKEDQVEKTKFGYQFNKEVKDGMRAAAMKRMADVGS